MTKKSFMNWFYTDANKDPLTALFFFGRGGEKDLLFNNKSSRTWVHVEGLDPDF